MRSVALMEILWTGFAPGVVALSSTILNVVLLADAESAWKTAKFPGLKATCADAVSARLPPARAAIQTMDVRMFRGA